MSFIMMIAAGLIPSSIAVIWMREHPAGGLFILGFAGSIIAGAMQYSVHQPIGFLPSLMGAVTLLVLYAVTARRKGGANVERVEKEEHEDFRRAA
jgi:uncharacterized membrane protein YeaQ/YmgE (transglycosylase-associated protein family)